MDKNRIKIIAGVVGTILALLFIILFIIVLLRQDGSKCELMAEQPRVISQEAENLVTNDFKNIATFAGYLVYSISSRSKEPEKIFLELKPNYIEYHYNELILHTDCCKIIWTFAIDAPNYTRRITRSIRLELVKANEAYHSCIISNPEMVSSLLEPDHYSCEIYKEYNCYSTARSSTLVATLAVRRLEFEIDGDPNLLRNGEYSTPPRGC